MLYPQILLLKIQVKCCWILFLLLQIHLVIRNYTSTNTHVFKIWKTSLASCSSLREARSISAVCLTEHPQVYQSLEYLILTQSINNYELPFFLIQGRKQTNKKRTLVLVAHESTFVLLPLHSQLGWSGVKLLLQKTLWGRVSSTIT